MDKSWELDRKILLQKLLDAVKQCQLKFNEKSRLATENDENVKALCSAFENVFQHGLKSNTQSSIKQFTDVTGLSKLTSMLIPVDNTRDSQKLSTFWGVLEEHLSQHELERFKNLKNIKTESGKVRAWFRSTLNEHSLEKYMHSIINQEAIIRSRYETWSFLLDDEKAVTLPNLAAGLSTILFALNIDRGELDGETGATTAETAAPQVDHQAQVIDTSKADGVVRSRRRKKPAKVINFDEAVGEGDSELDWKSNQDDEFRLTRDAPGRPRVASNDVASPSAPSDDSGPQNSDAFSFEYDQLSCHSPRDAVKEESYISFSKSESNLKDMGRGKNDKMSRLSALLKFETRNDSSPDDLLRPVGLDGQVIDVGVFKLLDPDTTSESYGSFDSQDMVDIEVLKQQFGDDLQNRQNQTDLNVASEVFADGQYPSQPVAGGKEIPGAHMNVDPSATGWAAKSLMDEIPRGGRNYADQHLKEKLVSLEKENSVLKDQLRSYIEAMRTWEVKNNALSEDSLKDKSNTTETKEYEQKLVQIAEMHAELMEFNAVILKKLNQKEVQLEHAMRELSSLSRLQKNPASGPKQSTINIIIPSAFLHGLPPNSYHVYQIYIRIRNEEWNVYRRYTEFYELHCRLKKELKNIRNLDFPPKRAFRKKDPKLVEDRRRKLEDYLKKSIAIISEAHPQVFGNPSRRVLMAVIPFFDNEVRLWDSNGRCTLRLQLSSDSAPSQSYLGL